MVLNINKLYFCWSPTNNDDNGGIMVIVIVVIKQLVIHMITVINHSSASYGINNRHQDDESFHDVS